MINKLKTIFPSIKYFPENNSNYPEDYTLYTTSNMEIIGIKKDEISKRDERILSSLLQPYYKELPELDSNEKQWLRRLHENDLLEDALPSFRLVYFSFQKNQIKPILFKEAIEALFNKPVSILWENETSGIIIEELIDQTDEPLSYNQIIDVLMSDLYVHIQFLVGPFIHTQTELKINHAFFQKHAMDIFNSFDKQVVLYTEAILSLLINQPSAELRKNAIDFILKEVRDEKDLLQTVKTFFQSNLNVSHAAKELYLHRNSLQYRLDKFIEKTGIDIRQFENAALVYFILLAKSHEG